jgi:1,3-beta-glucanosyltransferase GAS3
MTSYQPGGSAGYSGNGEDALSDGEVCQRDAVVLQRLGMNTIRVYNLDPDVDHTECASIFNAAGIYMIIDVNSPLEGEHLNRAEPWTTYNEIYMENVFKRVSAFMNFPNTLAFFSGNEVINEDSHPVAPAYMRAVTRDMKEYLANHAEREIPVGYSAADVRPLLMPSYNYLACELGNDTYSSKMDFFGLNSYAWCGESNMEDAEYDVLIENFGNATMPVFMSEYGCNLAEPRPFTEVGAIYSGEMMGVFSGGVVYEYSQEPNNYGLVNITDSGDVELFEDYDLLQEELNQLDISALTATNRTAMERVAPECSLSMISGTNFTQSFGVPEQHPDVVDFIANGVGGTWPTGVTEVTETAVGHTVTGSNGNEVSGLSLNILADDESNVPGNEPLSTGERVDIGEGEDGSRSGNSSGSGSGSGSSGSDEGAAVRVGGTQTSLLAMAAVGLGMFML